MAVNQLIEAMKKKKPSKSRAVPQGLPVEPEARHGCVWGRDRFKKVKRDANGRMLFCKKTVSYSEKCAILLGRRVPSTSEPV